MHLSAKKHKMAKSMSPQKMHYDQVNKHPKGALKSRIGGKYGADNKRAKKGFFEEV